MPQSALACPQTPILGRYREILRSKRSPQVLLEEGKYVTLARLGPDGKWRYQWSMFNRDAPARPYRE